MREERGGVCCLRAPSALTRHKRARECVARSAGQPGAPSRERAQLSSAFSSLSGPHAVALMAGTTETHVPMKLKVPDGTDPPVGLAGWRALDGAERTAIRTAYGQDVHVRVQGSGLHKACPSLPYIIDNDVAYLPLHIVESFYVRLMRLAPGVRHDLTVMVDPSALAEVERVALEQGLDASPTTPTVYLQRLQAL